MCDLGSLYAKEEEDKKKSSTFTMNKFLLQKTA